MSLSHVFQVRVYYEDTDFSGVVYHASYLRFMERGRTEMLRARGLSQGEIMAGNAGEVFGFAVRSMTIEFLKPARMDDLLTIESTPRAIGGATLELDQRVLRGEEVLITASVRIACVAFGRPARIPKAVREALGG